MRKEEKAKQDEIRDRCVELIEEHYFKCDKGNEGMIKIEREYFHGKKKTFVVFNDLNECMVLVNGTYIIGKKLTGYA